MRLKCSPNIAQAIMEGTLEGIKETDDFINDMGALNHHIQHLANILHCLFENGFTINPLKCEWVGNERQ